MVRYVFIKGKQRELMLKFVSCSGKSQLSAAETLGVPRRTLRNWITEDRTLSAEIFSRMVKKYPSLAHFSGNINRTLEDGWGRREGGRKCYAVLQEKYGESEFVKRRKAGGDASIKKRLKKIVDKLPAPTDECVLELFGALIGDGWIGISGGRKQVCFCGNLNQLAYAKRIRRLLFHAFGIRGYLKLRRKFTVFYIIVNSGPIFDFFRERFDFPVGVKKRFNTGSLPSEPEQALRVIRGIFDTDGGIYFDKGRGYARPYPVIDITSHNPELLSWIMKVLTEKGFKVISLKYSVRLKTVGQVERWFNEVKPSNRIHVQKWNRWKTKYMGP